MRPPALPALLSVLGLATTLGACGDDHGRSRHHYSHNGYAVTTVAGGSIYVKDNTLVVRNNEGDKAKIKPDATLVIQGDEVAVDEAQRKALNAYRAAYGSLGDDALALGVEGMNFGMSTVGKVFKGLLDGTVEQAGKDADAGAKRIDAKARGLCVKLKALRTAQDSVVEGLPAFRPYAVIGDEDLSHCQSGSSDETLAAADPGTPPPKPDASDARDSHDATGKGGFAYDLDMETGDWRVQSGTVVIPDHGKGEAVVYKDGTLRFGGDAVDSSEAARPALARYNAAGRDIEAIGRKLGLAGADLAMGALGAAVRGAFGGDTDEADSKLERRGKAMEAGAHDLCARLGDMYAAQTDATNALPAFRPYAVITERNVKECGVRKHGEHPEKKPDKTA